MLKGVVFDFVGIQLSCIDHRGEQSVRWGQQLDSVANSIGDAIPEPRNLRLVPLQGEAEHRPDTVPQWRLIARRRGLHGIEGGGNALRSAARPHHSVDQVQEELLSLERAGAIEDAPHAIGAKRKVVLLEVSHEPATARSAPGPTTRRPLVER